MAAFSPNGHRDDSLLSTSLPPLTSSPLDHHQAPPHRGSLQHTPSYTESLTSGRTSSSPTMDSYIESQHPPTTGFHPYNYHHSNSMTSMTPQLVAIQEMEGGVVDTPTSSPMLRPASGRFVGGMKKLLRIPSGVATSSAQAEMPSMVGSYTVDPTEGGGGELEAPDSRHHHMFRKVMKQIRKNPRANFSGLRRRPVRRKPRDRRHHHYSDDGYTSDPGLLRDHVLHNSHEEEEEDDTESGDRDGDRANRISRLQEKLEKHKKSLAEEEAALQEAQNVYVVGMEGSMNDKDQQRLKKNFISKQSKSKDEIEQLKRKVVRYEEQLHNLQQGRGISLTQPRYSHKVRNHFSRITHLGGVKQGIKNLRRKKTPNSSHQTIDIEDEDEEEMSYHREDDIESQSQVSFSNMAHINMKEEEEEEDPPCDYCLNEYNNLMVMLEDHKQKIAQIQQSQNVLLDKLQQEKDKSERLENELNTLTDLHQNGIIELRGQLAQMERISFGKSQDLEDNIENCQTRLHTLEVKITHSDDSIQRPVATGVVRKVGAPFLSYLLNIIAVCFKLSAHIGLKSVVAFVVLITAVVFYFMFYQS